MAEVIIKPKFTQAEIEEFGELLDIARFLLDRVSHIEIDTPEWFDDLHAFRKRRELFMRLVYGRLNPTGTSRAEQKK